MRTNTHQPQQKNQKSSRSTASTPSTKSTAQTAALLLLLALAATGAAFAQDPKADFMNVTGRSPLEGDALGDQITIYFDKEPVLAPLPDGSVPPPFTIQPPLPGQYTITGTYVSLKHGNVPRDPNQVYEVQLNPALKSKDGKPLNPEPRQFFFSNYTIEIQRWWVMEHTPTQVVFGLLLSAPVNLDMLRLHIEPKKLDNHVLPSTLEAGTNDRTFRLVLGPEVGGGILLSLTEGLQDASGKIRLATRRTYTCPTTEALKIGSLDWETYAYDEQVFAIVFSKPVSPKALQNSLVVTAGSNAVPIPAEVITTESNTKLAVKVHLFQVPPQGGTPAAAPPEEGTPDAAAPEEDTPDATPPENGTPDATPPEDGTPDATPPENATPNAVPPKGGTPNLVGNEVVVTINQGLQGIGGEVLLETYSKKLFRQPSGLAFAETSWNTRWYGGMNDKNGLILNVRLNKYVKAEDFKKHFEVTPAVENIRLEPESNGFQVYGDWNSKQAYEIRITPGIIDGEGKMLEQTLKMPLKTSYVPPYLGFGRGGEYYFPRRNGIALPLETRNLDKVEIILYRMFPSNLVVGLFDMLNPEGSDTFSSSWCEEVARTEVKIAGTSDRLTQTPLDLDTLFPQDKKGVFCLRAIGTAVQDGKPQSQAEQEEGYGEDEEGNYRRSNDSRRSASKLVLWTNMGVLAHWQSNELALFAHDLFSLAPVNLAKVTVYSSKNQLMGSTNTDASGIARLSPFDAKLGAPRVAVIELDGDFTFLDLTPRQDDAKEFTDLMPRYDRDGYDAFLYADRDLYRPGETIHAHWLVRTHYGDAVPDVPLLATVTKPNGQELLSQATVLSPFGTGGLDIATQKVYPTGRYRIALSVPGSKKVLGSYEFNLEEFVPNRMKASVTLDKALWPAGEERAITLNAQYLFGAPAADRKCEAAVIFKREPFKPENFKEYHFDNDSEFLPDAQPCGELMTDAAGNAVFKLNYTAPPKVTFPMKAIVVGRVFELGGRGVAGKAEATFFPSPTCLGVSAVPNADGKSVEVFAAAITPEGTAAPLDKVNITIEKQIWNYYVRRYYDNHEPRWSESFEPIETREVPLVGGKASTTFNVSEYGYYRVRVHSTATPQYSTLSFYTYWNYCRIVDTARPNLIKVTLDKESYAIGEEAVIRIESPFDGKGIVVLQGQEIQEMIPVEIKDQVGVVKYMVGPKQCPNVWVEATVIHAIKTDVKQVYPFSSFAMTNMVVHDPRRELSVAFPALPPEIRPATQAQFEIAVCDSGGAAAADAELTLAAVDEGIHSIKGYQNPDPHAWLYRPRQPDFRRTHYYDKVAYDFDKPAPGGDAMLKDLQKRLPSVDDNWIKPVALWSGVVRTDANGHAIVTMDVPEFTGQLRLVAVACTPGAVGSQSGSIFVRRPYMLHISMPRFLLPGDTIRCRAVVFNNSDAPCKAQVNWSFSGALSAGAGSQALDVPAHGEANCEASFAAGQAVGQGEIKWEAIFTNAAGQEVERLVQPAPIPVRAPAAFQTHNETIVLKPGETRELRNTQFLDNELAEIEVIIGVSPLLRLQDSLKYLVHYPYGCVEQTTSALMPMYLLRQCAAVMPTAFVDQDKLREYIQVGISRLFAMQTATGGLGMWAGSFTPYSYGSVYALHLLTLVKNGREFEVPAENFAALQRYVRNIANDWTSSGKSELFERAYAIYVLSLDGDLDAIKQIERFDTLTIPRHARYLLAAALALNTKDADRVNMYLSKAPSELYDVYEPYGSLNSDIRNTAIELLALRQIGGREAEVNEKATKLIDFLGSGKYASTQEKAFIVTALGAYLGDFAANGGQAAATITGNAKQDTLTGVQVYRGQHTGPGGFFTINNTGTVALFVNLTTRGLPAQMVTGDVSENGLNMSRTYLTSRGKSYTETSFAQTESYVTNVTITASKELHNVVVVDLLPAGFEIENPRLDADSLPEADIKLENSVVSIETAQNRKRQGKPEAAVTASYLDVRDDRMIVAFDTLRAGTYHFYYVVRAVTPGTYQHPSVEAECMYDGSVRARSGGGSIEVK